MYLRNTKELSSAVAESPIGRLQSMAADFTAGQRWTIKNI